jgi:copper chaperone CopZ
MKLFKTLTVAALLALSGLASAKTIEVEVNGLVCAFCAQGIEKTLRAFPATDDVFVSLEHRLVAVALKEGQSIDEATLTKAITDAGYTTVDIKYTDASLETLRSNVHNRPHNGE